MYGTRKTAGCGLEQREWVVGAHDGPPWKGKGGQFDGEEKRGGKVASLVTVFRKGELMSQVPENREDRRLCNPPPLCHYETFTLPPGEEWKFNPRAWHPGSKNLGVVYMVGWKCPWVPLLSPLKS